MTSFLTLKIIEGEFYSKIDEDGACFNVYRIVHNDNDYINDEEGFFEDIATLSPTIFTNKYKIHFRDIVFQENQKIYHSCYLKCSFEEAKNITFWIIDEFIRQDIDCDSFDKFFIIQTEDMPFFVMASDNAKRGLTDIEIVGNIIPV